MKFCCSNHPVCMLCMACWGNKLVALSSHLDWKKSYVWSRNKISNQISGRKEVDFRVMTQAMVPWKAPKPALSLPGPGCVTVHFGSRDFLCPEKGNANPEHRSHLRDLKNGRQIKSFFFIVSFLLVVITATPITYWNLLHTRHCVKHLIRIFSEWLPLDNPCGSWGSTQKGALFCTSPAYQDWGNEWGWLLSSLT